MPVAGGLSPRQSARVKRWREPSSAEIAPLPSASLYPNILPFMARPFPTSDATGPGASGRAEFTGAIGRVETAIVLVPAQPHRISADTQHDPANRPIGIAFGGVGGFH